ncbi:MAG: carbohydrate ABC transporter permease [Fimbriimonas sp.]|nr:carbohydrate ABC transporter permease [Fimbriimonas sp.]
MKNRGRIVAFVMMLIAIVFLAPAVLMVFTAFKAPDEVLNPSSAIPHHWTVENFARTLKYSEEAPFAQWLLNSLLISTSVTFLVLFVSSMCAFAIARLKIKNGSRILIVIVASMMIPGQLFLIPVYLMLGWFHWLDTPLALIVPATAGGFGVFMLTQFMRAIPPSLEEAALIDGCSLWGVYSQICLPLCTPALATLGIFTFIGSWNDFLGPLVFMDSVRNYTLPVGIALYQSSYYTEYGKTLATSVLGTAPLVIVYAIFQKRIISSMATTGLKD